MLLDLHVTMKKVVFREAVSCCLRSHSKSIREPTFVLR